MAVYAFWNNKGGVGKSYLTFQVATEYARTHPDRKILVIDLCPQGNASGMLLGGMEKGEAALDHFTSLTPRRTISGYVEDRISSPYVDPKSGAQFLTKVSDLNSRSPENLFLVCGDEQLEMQASRVRAATAPGPTDAWRIVHTWISDLIKDIQNSWDQNGETAVFVACNPSFSIYTELAMSASDRLIIPFSADGSSKRAVRALLALLYGITRTPGSLQSDYFLESTRYRLPILKIYCYVGNRLTQYIRSAKAFRTVVTEIGAEIWQVWKKNPNLFHIHPGGAPSPSRRTDFVEMFQFEIDANTASVVSSSLGMPINRLQAGLYPVAGRNVMVNQTQLENQQPNIKRLVEAIE